ncbi:putative F-box protein At3g10240 [Solanum stenotomum]|uniref:putative F-box protein At3g10240 n=1 Tax=Solanum stenotomum TaxID=172797 RepID=UPI0020D014A0|nr:putative F-box protein At3g10240 [Solanum stenotomum]
MEKEKTIAQAKSSISQDILYEIFSRLPDKSFTRFKCVSKFCNSLVSFKVLAWTYPQKKFYTIKQKSMISNESNLIRPEERIDEKGSAHLIKELNSFPYHKIDYMEGLFCLWNSSQSLPPIIFNPSTRKVTYLPSQNLVEDEIHEYHIILGYDPEKKMHKILLMTYPHNYLMSSSRYWIFTLGTSESWREIKLTNLFVTPPLRGICIDGVIYFFVYHNRERYFKMAAINLRAENFRIISLWNNYGRYYVVDMFDYIHLIEVKGKLAMVDVKEGKTREIILRILQNSETEEWMDHIIVFPQLLSRDIAKEKIYYLRNYVYSNTLNGEIVLMNSLIKPNWIFFYNFKKNSWREIEVLGFEEKVNIFGICSYII